VVTPTRVNFTRHYPDADFFVLSGPGYDVKAALENLFSMDDGPPFDGRESPVKRAQRRRRGAMYRDTGD